MLLCDLIGRSMLLELAQGFGLVTPDPFSLCELGGVWHETRNKYCLMVMGCLPTTNNYATKDWVTPYVTMIRFNRNFSKNINFGQLSASRCICIPWSLGSASEAGQDCFKECLHITRLKLPWYFLQSVYPTLPFLYLWSEMCWFRAACSFEILSQNNKAQIQMHWLRWEPQAP